MGTILAMNPPAWSHRSFTAPFTATARSALVPPPPWHYAGWLLNVVFRFDAKAATPLVPPAAGKPVGTGCVHFADWQACTDGHELLDPVLAQYRETIVVLEIERQDGTRCMYCPAIWVDQDISLLRGLLQGWPKKMGSTWLTRSLPLDHPAAAPLRAGSWLGASLAVKDRRVFEAQARLTGQPDRPMGFLARIALDGHKPTSESDCSVAAQTSSGNTAAVLWHLRGRLLKRQAFRQGSSTAGHVTSEGAGPFRPPLPT